MASFGQIWASLQDAPGEPPYMLIDCAGIDGGVQRIARDAFDQLECLFTGDLAVELADVGPYLGRMRSFEPDARSTAQDLLARQVGLLVVLREGAQQEGTDFSQLHRHFRKFNVVYAPDGKPLFFRYYDPRVLVDVLTVLNAEQLVAFFGPVEQLILMDSLGQVVRCRRQGGALSVLT